MAKFASIAACVLLTACASAPRDDNETALRSLSSAELRILVGVADTILSNVPDSIPVCISMMGHEGVGRRPAPDLVEAIRKHRDVVGGDECPRTFASMIQPYDSSGNPIRPPQGHIDPYHLVVGRPQYPERDSARIHVTLYHGTGGTVYSCTSYSANPKISIRCRYFESWAS